MYKKSANYKNKIGKMVFQLKKREKVNLYIKI